MTTTSDINITQKYFDNFHGILDRDGNPLTNVYWSYTSDTLPIYGTLYVIHGYGGSPVEPCLKLPMQQAIADGFNVVAIEGVDLSATSGSAKNLNSMTLARQKQAIAAGLRYATTIADLNTSRKIAWAHSISCRALAELIVDDTDMRDYFSEVVLNNPYFLAPPKVENMRTKLMQKDPSGKTWEQLTHKSSNMERIIENHKFKIPTCLYNLCVPLPPIWQSASIKALTRIMARFVSKIRMYCVLGTSDNMADYQQNMTLIQNLHIPHKELISIPGANHSFENELDAYRRFTKSILDSIIKHPVH